MANMSFASTGSVCSAVSNASFGTASQRTALVHNPYTFSGPYEVVLPNREEDEEKRNAGSGSFSHSGLSPKRLVCTSRMCNAALAFHVSTCPLARAHLAVPHLYPSAPESPATSPTSTCSMSPEPLSPISNPTEPNRSPVLGRHRIPFATQSDAHNHHRKMMQALRQDSHHHLLHVQLCGLQVKSPMPEEGSV
eukprot:GGOE01024861.1.p1 GENE.GGOE01024861.1~~GGOE01024861.1.p1  ORF type:complete len:206 (+),score=43.57 GGOE01024861.1:40-618(+)